MQRLWAIYVRDSLVFWRTHWGMACIILALQGASYASDTLKSEAYSAAALNAASAALVVGGVIIFWRALRILLGHHPQSPSLGQGLRFGFYCILLAFFFSAVLFFVTTPLVFFLGTASAIVGTVAGMLVVGRMAYGLVAVTDGQPEGMHWGKELPGLWGPNFILLALLGLGAFLLAKAVEPASPWVALPILALGDSLFWLILVYGVAQNYLQAKMGQ